MPRSEGRLWTTGRQILGNFVPIALGAPFLLRGLALYPTLGLSQQTLLALGSFPVVTWLAMNFTGLIGNIGLKNECGRRLHQERPFDKSPRTFVGFARPGSRSILDPHEDVGFLIFHPDSIEFWGSAVHVEVLKAHVKRICYRPNAHTWVGLGRWVCIEVEIDAKPAQLLVEPRERPTLIGNWFVGKKLASQLKAWLSSD